MPILSVIKKLDWNVLRLFLNTSVVQVFAKVLVMLWSVGLARLLGPDSFGRYSYVVSIVALVLVPLNSGFPQLVVREASRFIARQDRSQYMALWLWTTRYILIASVFCVATVCFLFYRYLDGYSIWTLVFLVLLIPARGFLVRQATLVNAHQKTGISQFLLIGCVPAIGLAALFLIGSLGVRLAIEMVFVVTTISTYLSYVVASVYLRKVSSMYASTSSASNPNGWGSRLTYLVIIGFANTASSEILIVVLGNFLEFTAIGVYKVTLQCATVALIGIEASNSLLAPRIAPLLKNGDGTLAQKLLSKYVPVSFLITLTLAMPIVIFGDVLLVYLFGQEYLAGLNVLRLIVVTSVVNVAFGPVGLVLNLAGFERITLNAHLISIALMYLLLNILVPKYGIMGAAISSSTSIILWNIVLSYFVYVKLGLKCFVRPLLKQ